VIAALITLAVFLVLTIALPVLAFRRASAAREDLERLERRLASVEDRVRQGRSITATAAAEPDPAGRTRLAPRCQATGTTPPAATQAHLEARIGKRWMLYVGVATLVVGVELFIRYAFVNRWITEPLRVGTGGLAGTLLIMAGRRFATAGHARFGHTLVGGGLATWYLAVYAALNLYGLVNTLFGFILPVLVTGLAAVHADRLRSQPLALMAVVGGFGTPFLVDAGTTAQSTLFSYTALLIGATVYLASRRDWPALNLASFLLTGLTVLVWVSGSYDPGAYLLTELFFTLFCGLFLWVLYSMRGSTHPIASRVRLALWTTPVWYHGASLAILGDHWLALLVYLIAVTGVGVVFSVGWEATWMRVVLWAAVALPLLEWTGRQPDVSWLAPAVVTWLAVASMHAAAQVELLRRARARLHAADVLLFQANGLSLYFGLQAILEPRRYALLGLVAAALAITHGAMAVLVRRVEPRAVPHLLVAAISLAVVAVTVQLDGAWVTMLWATEAAGLIWLGLRERRDWIRAGGALLLGVVVVRLLATQLAPVPAVYTVFVNQRATLGFFIVGTLCLVAWLHARTDPESVGHRRLAIAMGIIGANALMLVTVSVEIYAFWELRADTMRFASSAELVRQMMLSATWATYAAGLTAVGIRRNYAPVRYLAIGVFAITVLKVFTVDLSQLDSVYHIVSRITLSLLLVGVLYMYQRYGGRLSDPVEGKAPRSRGSAGTAGNPEAVVPEALSTNE